MSESESDLPPCVRRLDEPRAVWVDVHSLLRPHSHHLYRQTATGVELGYEVPGVLREWVQDGDGAWLGLVRYLLTTRDGEWSREVEHYVPAHLLRRMKRSRAY